MHRLQEGHDGARERRRQLLDDAALDDRRRGPIDRFEGGEMAGAVVPRLVEGGDVGSRQRQQVAQARGAGRARALPAARQIGQLDDGLLALAQHEGVDEGRERLRVEGGAAARDHDGVVLAAVARARGDARQVEHVEHVRVGQLVLQGEAEDVEFAQGVARFEAPEGRARAAHLRLHVGPGREGAFAERVLAGVEQVVEDAEAHVGHADVVGVGVGQGHAHGGPVPVLHDGVPFAAGIAPGLAHAPQQPFDLDRHRRSPATDAPPPLTW